MTDWIESYERTLRNDLAKAEAMTGAISDPVGRAYRQGMRDAYLVTLRWFERYQQGRETGSEKATAEVYKDIECPR